ncbi:TonB family protein [Brevundimonas lenta]|uniref:Protein TonB n=1 Tax=Brevundimonas lenta TaxID=424796 RepID=A0A7W6JCP4_9CAUL|nr:TonB family protein [Brevundimonas lenta]MBB4082616.1 protein TonB [Brevundimonas lenta]
MMIRTAGGPGTVSPINFNERRTQRLSRSSWIAIGIVAAAHVGVGVALYYQRFEMPAPLVLPEPRPITVTMEPVPEKPVEKLPEPAAPNTAIHHPAAPPTTVDTNPVALNDDAKPAEGPVISITRPVDKPVEDARPAVTPDPPVTRVITSPSWSRQPSAEQLMRAYPDRALARGVSGSASLNCLVQADGTVASCDITGETPAGQGFGRAAQSLSRYFRINPRTVNGAAEGSRVAINLRFVPPAE